MSVPEHLLLHTCCAPCLIAPYHQLKNVGIKVSALWFNPNIHPVTEYRSRLEALKSFAEKESFPLLLRDEYGLRDFVRTVAEDINGRCEYCYTVRLEATVKAAVELGCDAWSTTLLYSKYQKHDLIRSIGESLARKHGIAFFYRDWRPLWEEGIRLSKQEEMYRQKYCGCIFSEEERYMGTTR